MLTACKTNKNTFIHRGYHNLTARFNGYYYATESIKEGEDKIRTGYKYDYDRLLPVYIMPDNQTAKNTFAEFDKAIKKSSTCIQRHTIKDKKGNEIYTAGKWIDNNWNVIGISHFYKREFFSGIEAFEYVIRSYKSKDKYKSMIWLARSYNEIGAPSQAEPIIGLLKDDKGISKYAKKELPALRADYYLQRGMYKEAEQALLLALKAKPKKQAKARYSFILAQLYEEKKENRKAIQYYQKTIAAKPDYDLVFNARMKQARLSDLKTTNPAKLKRSLLNMTREEKNSEYLDAIYYTLGEICEKEKNEDLAIKYYQLSVKNSTTNPKQKALSYLKLGEINFERANYTASGSYYDSTMITLPKDYKDYDAINKRKTTLETLVSYIRTIQREDSLQRIAKMSDADRSRFITKMIKQIEEEEQRKKDELDALNAQNQNPNYNPSAGKTGLPTMPGGASAGWYFYNQTTISFGLNDFVKKWGNRKLEDNWRRSQKSLTFDTPTNETDSVKGDNTTNNTTTNNSTKSNNRKNIEYYLKDLPLADSLIKKSDIKIVDAYYNLGSTYKEELNNNKKAITTFEELNSRYPENKYRLSTYFQMYRIYQSTKNQSQADYYKNKLLNEYPNSEYAQIIKNPNYVSDKNSQKGEVELYYTETYSQYEAANYTQAFDRCKESESKFGKNDFSARFAFIKAICIGKLKGVDSLESSLKQLQALYPKDPTATEAQNILQIIYRLKHPSEATATTTNTSTTVMATDSFNLDLNEEHYVIAVYPDNAEIASAFNTNISNFHGEFYTNDNLSVVSSLFGATDQIVCVKKFKNAENAKNYITNLTIDKTVFSGKVKLEQFTVMAISSSNYPKFFKKKQVSYYKPFYEDHYLKK